MQSSASKREADANPQCPQEPKHARTAAGSASARVKAMEVAVVFSPSDYAAYLQGGGRTQHSEAAAGYSCSGSYAGRNIEAIYQRAEAAGVSLSLEDAVAACLGPRKVRHVLICSGFYVLHSGGAEPPPGVAPGSCETDGPLGALALLRAFASRGVRASLFCDAHNGPVLRAAYEEMMRYFAAADEPAAIKLAEHSRCLPFVSDAPLREEARPGKEEEEQAFARRLSEVFPGAPPAAAPTGGRAVRVAMRLASALRAAWGDEGLEQVDCLFALERLGMPYRNIRGRAIGEHTEPIDWLWPVLSPATASSGSLCQASVDCLNDYAAEAKISPAVTAALRAVAGVAGDALTLGIGDGGNEVGMGKVAHLEAVAQLAPRGQEFVALSVNGCYCTCDHLVLSTVSNWGGAAFEMAAHALFPPDVDYAAAMRRRGDALPDLEERLLAAAVAAHAVDGISSERRHKVDGMEYDPHHRRLYELLWALAGAGGGAAGA